MIDLSRTPSDLQEKIMKQYNTDPCGNMNTLMSLFMKKKMNVLLNRIEEFTPRV